MDKIRVMIVEDSRVVRELLEYLVSRDPRLEVAAALETAEEALAALDSVSPHVVSMDIRLPGMNGLEATRRIMRERPTPIVVVAASVDSDDLQIAMNALRHGALAVVEKPRAATPADYQQLAQRLCTQLAVMSQVKVVRQRFGGAADSPQPPRGERRRRDGAFEMLAIVASTGGPAAVQKLLSSLPTGFPLPIALVQHMSEGFLEGFVAWLDGAVPFDVVLAQEGQRPRAGTVYVPPAGHHLALAAGAWRLDDGPPVSSQRPSGTILFRSLAESLGPRALAVLLTGMGDDGAAGLKAVRDAGGFTIAEDASTAVVYGMPAAAVRLGGVCQSLPLDQIGPRLEQLTSGQREQAR